MLRLYVLDDKRERGLGWKPHVFQMLWTMTLGVLHIGFYTSHTHKTIIPLTHYTCTLMSIYTIYTIY